MLVAIAMIVGKVMIGPNLCEVDYLQNNQIYTVKYVCQENGTLLRESVGMLPSTKS
jgi:hypothetical protein